MDECLIVFFLQLHVEGNESKTVDSPTTVHSEARMRNFLHSWVQSRDTGLRIVEGCPWWRVKLHSHISGLPSHSRPLPHCPTQANVNEWQESDIPQVASSPVKNSKRASADPMETRRAWSFLPDRPLLTHPPDTMGTSLGTSQEKSCPDYQFSLSGGSYVPLSCPKHWNNWW